MYCANCFSKITDDGFTKCTNSGVMLHGECANPCIKCGAPLSDQQALANNSICIDCQEANKITVDHIRRSHIEDYKICPYKFKLQAIDGKEGPNNPYAYNGILLHDLFEDAIQERIDKEKIIELYLKGMEDVEGYTDYQIKDNLPKREIEKGLRCIDTFYKHVYDEPFMDTEVTIQYEIGEDMPKVQCTFDMIREDEKGGLHLIDYKTGRVHVGKKLANDLQIPLYIMAIESHYGKLPETFQLLFLSEAKERTYVKESDDLYVCTVGKRRYEVSLTETVRELNSIFSKIQRGLFSIPFGELSSWHCKNRCGMYQLYCEGVDDEAHSRHFG